MVHGLKIRVMEETIVVDSGLPISDQQCFVRKTPLSEFPDLLLCEGEQVKKKGKGYKQISLPPPWAEVAFFFIRYVTCEGLPSTIYKYHLKLLISMCFQQRINMPYFLWNNIQRMALASQFS